MTNIYYLSGEFLEKNVSSFKTLSQLIRGWEYVIGECEDGYAWDISELHNEMYPRELLENIKVRHQFKICEGYDEFIIKLEELDMRFKKLLQENIKVDGKYWWLQGVLKKSGEPYRTFMKEVYGIDVDEV